MVRRSYTAVTPLGDGVVGRRVSSRRPFVLRREKNRRRSTPWYCDAGKRVNMRIFPIA